MAGFMNKELEMIRNNLLCGYCGKHFKGSDSQARNVKYQKREVYCSDPCRHTAIAKKNSTPIPSRGPCKTCGKPFSSRTAKIYCSLACYVKSDQFKAMQTENMENNKSPERRAKMAASLRTGEMVKCLECGEETYSKRGRKRRFCSTSCYRAYMAKRFDRWAANPANIALPQGYDEFLDQEELPCVVEGCNWQGKHLSLHINRAHGITAEEFKRAAGFNLSTGVISRPLVETLQQRPKVGIVNEPFEEAMELARAAVGTTKYKSLEGKEHMMKARAMWDGGPERTCVGCGVVFRQSTPAGKALYCSRECRNAFYNRQRRAKTGKRVISPEGSIKESENANS